MKYNMMSRDKFKKTINMLIKKDKEIGWFYDKFKSSFLIENTGEYFGAIADLLSHAMNDKCEYVSWWLFECNYGQDTPYVWEDDKKIILDSIDKLYDFLVENSKVPLP